MQRAQGPVMRALVSTLVLMAAALAAAQDAPSAAREAPAAAREAPAAAREAPAAAREMAAPKRVVTPWRLGQTANYRLHTSYRHVREVIADPSHAGVFWLATSGGLVRYAPRSGATVAWTRVDGLPSGRLRNLSFDVDAGYLWVATDAGLARMKVEALAGPNPGVETVGVNEPRGTVASGFLRIGREAGSEISSETIGVWFWNESGIYDVRAEDSEAFVYTLGARPWDVAVLGAEIVWTNGAALWALDTSAHSMRQLLAASDLVKESSALPTGQPALRWLTRQGDALWIGTAAHGVFRFQPSTGDLSRPAFQDALLARCGKAKSRRMSGRVVFAGDEGFAVLGRCLVALGETRVLHEALPGAIVAGPVVDAAGETWFVGDEGFYRLANESTRFALPASALAGANVTALLQAHGKLFVGAEDSALSILDLAQGVWTQHDRIGSVRRLRTVHDRNELVVLGRGGYWWLDPDTLRSRRFDVVPPGGERWRVKWTDVRDVEVDGEVYWLLRREAHDHKSERRLYQLAPNGVTKWSAASGYVLGRLLDIRRDASVPHRLWLVRYRKGRELIDFDPRTGESELVGLNRSQRAESQLLRTALADRELRRLSLSRHEALDPDDPDKVWTVSGQVYVRGWEGRVLSRYPVRIPSQGPVVVTRAQTTRVLWAGSGEGLIELELPMVDRL